MRIIGVLLISLFTAPTFASNLVCERPISSNEVEYAVIDTWPEIRIFTGVKKCIGNGGFQFCVDNVQDVIASSNQVCGYSMNTQRECRSRDWYDGRTQVTEIDCARSRIRARVQTTSQGRARITCARNGRVERTWNFGECF